MMKENIIYEDQAVTNPITGKQDVVHEAINKYVDSARFDILRIINNQPVTASSIENHGLVSR